MVDLAGFAAVPSIVVIVYLIGLIFHSVIPTDKVNKFIPIICAGSGLILGILCFLFAPELIPATDIFTASAIGIVSGSAATGVNQIYKQLTNTNKPE